MAQKRLEFGERLPNQAPSGVDLSQLAQNLRLMPAERLSRMVAWTRWIRAHQGIAQPRTRR